MSKPIASPSPGGSREQRRRRPRPRPGPRGRSRRRPAPPRRPRPTPPEERITSRLGQPALDGGLGEAAQVAAEQGGEVGVDDGGRAALVLAEGGQHLVRGGDVDVRAAPRAGASAIAPLVARVEVGEEQADRDGLGSAARELARPAGRPPPSASASITPSGADPLGGLEAQLVGDQGLRLGRAGAVEARAVLAADLEQVGEPPGRDQRGARAALLEQGVGAHGHPVGEAPRRRRRRRRRARAPPRPRRSRPRDWSSGVVGTFAVCRRSPSSSAASVKVPPTSTPSSMARTYHASARHGEGPDCGAAPRPGRSLTSCRRSLR